MSRTSFVMYDSCEAFFYHCLPRMILVLLIHFFFPSLHFKQDLEFPDQYFWAFVMQNQGKRRNRRTGLKTRSGEGDFVGRSKERCIERA